MDYKAILEDIKPTLEEKDEINSLTSQLVDYLNKTCIEEGIDAKIAVVGSVAKNTALKGKSDIDIFMAFPLDTERNTLRIRACIWPTDAAMNLMAMRHIILLHIHM